MGHGAYTIDGGQKDQEASVGLVPAVAKVLRAFLDQIKSLSPRLLFPVKYHSKLVITSSRRRGCGRNPSPLSLFWVARGTALKLGESSMTERLQRNRCGSAALENCIGGEDVRRVMFWHDTFL